jgi:transcriptional regulator with XRE-family HTH domain
MDQMGQSPLDGAPAVTFGTLLRRYRRAAGLTQEALAERAHLGPRSIRDLERGVVRAPQRHTVDLLSAALSLSPREQELFVASAQRRGRGTPASRFPPSVPGAPEPALVGREQELGLLERHVAGVGPPVLLLAGEPGIGKSRLLGEAVTAAVHAGWTVLQGGCQRRAGQEPYAPLLGALQGYVRRQAPAHLRADLRGCAWLVEAWT